MPGVEFSDDMFEESALQGNAEALPVNPDLYHEQSPDTLSFLGKIVDIARVAKEDFERASLRGKVIVGGLVGMTFYEYSVGNETTTAGLVGQALDSTHGVTGAVIGGVIGGAVVGGQQFATGYLARRTAQEFPTVSEKVYTYMSDGEDGNTRYVPFDNLSKTKKWLYSMFLGSSFTVTREALVTGDTGDESLAPVGRKSAMLSGGTIALLCAGVSIAEEVGANNESVQMVTDTVKNPLAWIALGTAIAIKESVASRIKRRRQRDSD